MSATVGLTKGIPSQIKPGLIVGDKYRLEAEIGHGSMGTVYRAVHVTLGQRVAIKLISSEHSQSTEARKRFSVEAKAAAKLRSRHVVQVYDDGETPEGNPYIVLELLEGETLEQRLQREHDLPLGDAVRVVSHVARALARAHAHGIVHRDLKPANIFLVKSDDDEVGFVAKVLDFGIAKLQNQGEKGTTQAGTVLGTPLFMSPEQVRGASSVDHRADLYSLGMCLYHMLTGEYAYYSDNYSDTLVGICTQPLPQLRAAAPWAPEAVETWFQRACAKEPLDRFQSADEMSEALQAAAGSPALAKHQSFPEGRIAPETLVGYGTPAAVTLKLASGGVPPMAAPESRSARAAGGDAVPLTPIAIAPPRAARSQPRRDADAARTSGGIHPLWIGFGLGLLTVLVTAVALVLLGAPSPLKPATRDPGPATPGPANDAVGARQAATPAPPTAAVSSEAAESPTQARTAPTVPSTPLTRSTARPPRPARNQGPARHPAGSDLGF